MDIPADGNKDIDVRSYFMEKAPKSGQNAHLWKRTVEVLTENGILTMRQLDAKGNGCLVRLFIGDRACLDIARRAKYLYSLERHTAELLKAGEVLVEAYFKEHAPPSLPLGMTARAVNALRRAGIVTMSALCGASAEELGRVRNMGDKSLELALMMRSRYMAPLQGEAE